MRKILLILLFLPFLSICQTSAYYYRIDATSDPCGGSTSVTYSGKTYNIVAIGNQCWFAQNLNYGGKISGATNQTDNETTEKYCYNDIEDSCSVYGGLYQWDEAMQYVTTSGAQGICPSGWHIPTGSEVTTLLNYLEGSSVAGGKMKQTGTRYWSFPNTGANNESGFTGLGGGWRNVLGAFVKNKEDGVFYTSTEPDETNASAFSLVYNSAVLAQGSSEKTRGYSVRCLKN